jgi:hypothetical protein
MLPDEKPATKMTSDECRKGASDVTDLKQRLSDEYKMLQDKIDKIGAFRFTIKGWSVTAVVAALATANPKDISTACIVSLGLVIMLVFFFRFEREQVKLGLLFGYRAGRIEDAFARIRRGKGGQLHLAFATPDTAHEIAFAGRRNSPKIGARTSTRRKGLGAAIRDKWKSNRGADADFYLFLIFLALSPLLVRYHEVGQFLQGWEHGATRLLLILRAICSNFITRMGG